MFLELLSAISDGAVKQQGIFTAAGLKKLAAYFESDAMPELRIFVANASEFGHLATTVHILKRMIALGFRKPIRVVYEWAAGGKLEVLLPGFDQNTRDPIEIGGVKILFTVLENPGHDLQDKVPLAITGGYDVALNLSAKLNVDLFLELQPYLWEEAPNLLWLRGNSTPIDLTEQETLQEGLFLHRAYYADVPVISEKDWSIYAGMEQFKQQIPIVRTLLSYFDGNNNNPTANLLPVYGIAPSERPTLVASPWVLLFNLTTAVLRAQNTGTNPTNKLRTIVVVLQDMSAHWSRYEALLSAQTPLALKQYLEQNQVRARVKVQQELDADLLKANIDKLQDNQVLAVAIPRVPPDVFNLIMGSATYPFVFEGRGTENFALNLGFPYLHLTKPKDVKEAYPFVLVDTTGVGFAKMAQFANSMQDDPSTWSSSVMETPAGKVGALLTQGTATKDNSLKTYFGRIRNVYHNPVNDKLILALLFTLPFLPQPNLNQTTMAVV